MKKMVLLLMLSIFTLSCRNSVTAPAVEGFELEKYLGVWYEVARLPNRFERGMTRVTAEYLLQDDGSIQVINSGIKNGIVKSITGTARLQGKPGTGALEVSFFWPFYQEYRIVMLAEDYSYSVVCGSSPDYLWILSRTTGLAPEEWEKIKVFLRLHFWDPEQLLFSYE